MAGITANSTSVTMASSEGVDITKSGYTVGEVVTLAAEPTGSAYLWTLAPPSGSSAVLTSETDASPKFKADVAGDYVVTVVVDATTTYVARLTATTVTISWAASGIRLVPIAAASVATPATGYVMFLNASNGDALSLKDSSGTVTAV